MNYWFYGNKDKSEDILKALDFLGISNPNKIIPDDESMFYYTYDEDEEHKVLFGVHYWSIEELVDYVKSQHDTIELTDVRIPKFKVGEHVRHKRPKNNIRLYYKVGCVGKPTKKYPSGYYDLVYNDGWNHEEIPISEEDKYVHVTDYELSIEEAVDWLEEHSNEYVFNDKHNGNDYIKVRSEMFTDFREFMLNKNK